jgi:hypothetical protein
MTTKINLTILTAVFFMGTLLYAGPEGGHHKKMDMAKKHSHKKTDIKKVDTSESIPSKNELVIKIDGLVCSFCAYGTEKNLSKIDFIDRSTYGGDGVFVEIEQGFVKLSLNPKKTVDLKELIKAVRKGGYVANEVSFWVRGKVKATKGGYVLEKTKYPYTFNVLNFDKKDLTNKEVIVLIKHKIPKKFPSGALSVEIEKNTAGKKIRL